MAGPNGGRSTPASVMKRRDERGRGDVERGVPDAGAPAGAAAAPAERPHLRRVALLDHDARAVGRGAGRTW